MVVEADRVLAEGSVVDLEGRQVLVDYSMVDLGKY